MCRAESRGLLPEVPVLSLMLVMARILESRRNWARTKRSHGLEVRSTSHEIPETLWARTPTDAEEARS
jgi:hypothetical protein